MIPLVMLDLDGTVIGSNGGVQDCVWEAVEKVRAAGMRLSVCTGRPCGGVAQKVAQRLGSSSPHIFQSGAVVCYPDGNALQVSALKEQSSVKIIEHARANNLTLEIYTPNALFIERKTPIAEAHAKMLGMTPIVRDLLDVAENEPVVRAQWVIPEEAAAKALGLKLEGIQVSSATSPALKNTLFISLTQTGVSKGTAVKFVADTLKVKLANVMGVGDSEGDLPMLEVVGHPIVMLNASEELRERFLTVGDVESCGVVEALEHAMRLEPA